MAGALYLGCNLMLPLLTYPYSEYYLAHLSGLHVWLLIASALFMSNVNSESRIGRDFNRLLVGRLTRKHLGVGLMVLSATVVMLPHLMPSKSYSDLVKRALSEQQFGVLMEKFFN